MEEQAVRGVRWTFLGYAVTRATGVAGTLVLARLLLPGDIGVMALASALVGLVGHVAGLALGPAFVVRQDLDRAQLRAAFSLFVLAGLGTAAVVAGMAPLAGVALRNRQTASVMLAIAVPLLFSGVTLFYESALQRELRFRTLFVARAAQNAAGMGLSIVLAAAGRASGAWSAAGSWARWSCWRCCWPGAASSSGPHGTGGGRLAAALGVGLRAAERLLVRRAEQRLCRRRPHPRRRAPGVEFDGLPHRRAALRVGRRAHRPGHVPGVRPGGSTWRGPERRLPFHPPADLRLRGPLRDGARRRLRASGPYRAGPAVECGDQRAPLLAVWGTVRGVSGTIGWFVSSTGHAARLGRAYSARVLVSVPVLVLAVQHLGLPGAGLVMLANAVAGLIIGATIASRRLGVSRRRQWDAARPAILAGGPGALAGAAAAAALRTAPAAVALAGAVVASVAVYLAVLVLQDPGLVGTTARQLRRVVRGAPAGTAAEEAGAGEAAEAVRGGTTPD